MHDLQAPKVVVNEDFLDLRNEPQQHLLSCKKRSSSCLANIKRKPREELSPSLCCENRHEKELINCGLKKLATSYTANYNKHFKRHRGELPVMTGVNVRENGRTDTKRIRSKTTFEAACMRSQSDASLFEYPPKNKIKEHSTACFVRKQSSAVNLFKPKSVVQVDSSVNKNYRLEKSDTKVDRKNRCHSRSKSKDYDEVRQEPKLQNNFIVNHATNYVDQKLCETYSTTKIPGWKRTWTLPVFTPKSKCTFRNDAGDNFDRTTYLYDDGTDIDSAFQKTDKGKIRSSMMTTLCVMALDKQFVVVLFLIGSICGFLLVSALIWFVFGNEFLDLILKPRPAECKLSRYFKYIGDGIIRFITTIFEAIGKVFLLPAQQVYQTQENTQWPLNSL